MDSNIVLSEISIFKDKFEDFETNMLLRVQNIKKLPHLPFLKRKLNAILSDD